MTIAVEEYSLEYVAFQQEPQEWQEAAESYQELYCRILSQLWRAEAILKERYGMTQEEWEESVVREPEHTNKALTT